MITARIANAASAVNILEPADAANTAAATSGWVSVADYDGFLVFTQHVGTVTAGTITGKIRHATDDQGTGAADVTGGGFTAVTTSNDHPNIQKVVVELNAIGPYVQYVGTIATGPAVVGVSMLATAKSV